MMGIYDVNTWNDLELWNETNACDLRSVLALLKRKAWKNYRLEREFNPQL